MSGPDVPSDIPEEYADAYREAYEKALREIQNSSVPVVEEPAVVKEPVTPAEVVPPPSGTRSGTLDQTTEYNTRPAWLVPVAIAAVALTFIGCAYVLGRMVSGEEAPTVTTERSQPADPSTTAAGNKTTKPAAPDRKPWKGEVDAIAPTGVNVSCTAPDGVDARGQRVTYRASQMYDGNHRTAWRCVGMAIGQRIELTLPADTRLAEVGLIPGYAKTDPKTKVDRYAENNRLTKVRWILADGTEIEQTLSGDPKDRSMRTIRVPATEGGSVTLEILEVAKGKRNTTMISEVRLASAV